MVDFHNLCELYLWHFPAYEYIDKSLGLFYNKVNRIYVLVEADSFRQLGGGMHMAVWWAQLSITLKILYCIAAPSTLILVIQTLMSLLGGLDGGGGDNFSDTSGLDLDAPDLDAGMDAPDFGDLDADVYTDGSAHTDGTIFRVFTLQGIVAFLTVFSWSTIGAISSGAPSTGSIIVGLALGAAAMFAIARLVQVTARLAENGTIDLRNGIGERGQVYIIIPANGGGSGKIMLKVQSSLIECAAVTREAAPLETGAPVRVIDVIGDTYVVERDTE